MKFGDENGRLFFGRWNAVPGRGDSQKAAAEQTRLKLGQPCTPEGSSQVRKWLSDHGVNHCKPKKEHVYMFLPDMGMQQWRFVVKS